MLNFLVNLKINFNFNFIWILFFFHIGNIVFFDGLIFTMLWIFIFFYQVFFKCAINSFNIFFCKYYYYINIIITTNWFLFFLYFQILNILNFLKKTIVFCTKYHLPINNKYVWNPLIKQYSYIGYFKINSLQWNYSKVDEINRYKY